VLFNSVEFGLFFVVVYSLYLLASRHHRWQNRLLLVAGYVFYGAWDWRFLGLLLFSTTVDYWCGRFMAASRTPRERRRYLLLSLCTNFTLLGFFKYFNFFIDSANRLLSDVGLPLRPIELAIILPVGISFYTFQGASYSIDVYRGILQPTRRFEDFATFVSFFPQLVAGPIERATHLLPQVMRPRIVTVQGFAEGCRLVLWGLFQKVVVADQLGLYVDAVYGNIRFHTGVTLLLATVFFALQIYCDFNGYSTIARGLGRLMGFEIMVNFRTPYFATSIRDFWSRWHISLSTWLRDYLYIPLGGNRGGRWYGARNVMITMLLGGLWHGASWTFVIWGGLHGVYIVLSRLVSEILPAPETRTRGQARALTAAGWASTMALVLVTWVFFRAQTLSDAMYVLRQWLTLSTPLYIGDSRSFLVQCALGIACVIAMDWLGRHRDDGDALGWLGPRTQWAVAYALVFGIITLGVESGAQFIYFQF
jgi:alginate O-acetyltransferase complex protein AlgI